MIVLPKGAFTVIRSKAEEKTTTGIYLPTESQKKPNFGTIAFTSEELNEYQGCEVVFRENFGEELEIEGTEHLFFRDFDSSIYYIKK